MKPMTYSLKQLMCLLFLTGMLFLSPSLPRLEIAMAQKPAVVENLSDRVAKAVIADLAQQTKIPAKNLKITQYSPKTWSNGCLGLAKADEICTQALVEGWRVVVSGNNRTWVYRSDRNGRSVRLEPQKK